MTAAIAQREQLRERSTLAGVKKVDREKGIIYGAKLLGERSKNNGGKRRYAEQAMQKLADHFYPKINVNGDHGAEPGDSRSVLHRAGWVETSWYDSAEKAVFGDVHTYKESPAGRLMLEMAERNPQGFGFSHDIDGLIEEIDGEYVVTDAYGATSVDGVDRPATTRGVFESEEKTVKLSEFVKSLKESDALRPTLIELAKSNPDVEISDKATGHAALLSVVESAGKSAKPANAGTTHPPTQVDGDLKSLTEAMTKLAGVVESQQKTLTELAAANAKTARSDTAAGVLESIGIDRNSRQWGPLHTELCTLETREAMENRSKAWPDHIRDPEARPVLEAYREPESSDDGDAGKGSEKKSLADRWGISKAAS